MAAHVPGSALLCELSREAGRGELTLKGLLDRLGERSFGLVVLLMALLGLCLCAAGGPGAAQAPPAQPSGAADAWQRQQPTRDRTQELLQQEGIRPGPAERREELRSLNEIHRELMPQGAVPPAPGLAPSSGAGEARRETGRD